jgi:ABC-type thiamine transport system substrate-binding protein
MPYKLQYKAWISWVPAGTGVVDTTGGDPSRRAQTLEMNNSNANAAYGLVSATFTTADQANLLNAMKTDLTTQFSQNAARIQGFATGGG